MQNERSPMSVQLTEEASEWFVLMREASVSSGDREDFSTWLRASPLHVGAYIEIAKLWGDAAHVNPLLDVNAGSEAFQNVTRLPGAWEIDRGSRKVSGELLGHAAEKRFHPLKLVAGLLIAGAMAVGIWLSVGRTQSYSDGVAEQRVITLDDGSIVHLDSRSKLTVRFSRHERRIDLSEGQALFEVAHDVERPFIVNCGGVGVRAVGTQFNVNGLSAHTVVTVVEGRVRLSGIADPGSASLSAGQQATVDRHGQVEMQLNADVAASTSWLQHRLTFQGARLGEIVEEFNRYNRVPIILTDPELLDMRVNAVFGTTDSAPLLQFLSRLDGVRVERSGDGNRIHRSP
jgi:transmembrane sensor